MGILGLSKLIADIAPMAVKETEIKNYFGWCSALCSNFLMWFYIKILMIIVLNR